MPTIPGFLRRRGQPSDSDMDVRRHSFYTPSEPASLAVADRVDGRTSEQLPRKPSMADLLFPSNASTPAIVEPSATPVQPSLVLHQRPQSPPVQQDTPKLRRFSMLKFRHASESQLSTRARQQAEALAAPPVPKRTSALDLLSANQ